MSLKQHHKSHYNAESCNSAKQNILHGNDKDDSRNHTKYVDWLEGQYFKCILPICILRAVACCLKKKAKAERLVHRSRGNGGCDEILTFY